MMAKQGGCRGIAGGVQRAKMGWLFEPIPVGVAVDNAGIREGESSGVVDLLGAGRTGKIVGDDVGVSGGN